VPCNPNIPISYTLVNQVEISVPYIQNNTTECIPVNLVKTSVPYILDISAQHILADQVETLIMYNHHIATQYTLVRLGGMSLMDNRNNIT
jgi:hypothetical protein